MKSREVINILTKAGFIDAGQSGSHLKLRKDERTTIVPVHPGDIKKGTLCSIWDQAGLKDMLKGVCSEKEALKRLNASVKDASTLLPEQQDSDAQYKPNPDIPYPADISTSYKDWTKKVEL